MCNCIHCGKESSISLTDADGVQNNLCANCYNKIIADLAGIDLPEAIPQMLFSEDCNKVMHNFKIEFMIFPNGLSLKAIEVAPAKYECAVFGELDEDFGLMWSKLLKKLKKMMRVKYIVDNRWKKDKVVGYINYNNCAEMHDVVIDGNPYSWE